MLAKEKLILPGNTSRQGNNFDFSRLLFASFVIITHSYVLTGTKECDWLCQAADGQINFSWLAVRGFFVISGFLIFQSMERCRDLADFYWKRVLRLFPALVAVLVLTVILGPFVYENDTFYILTKSVRTYIGNNLLIYKLQYGISGIFENNPYKSVINGSLWTIPFEFTMYVFVSALFFIRKRKALVRTLIAVIYIILAILDVFYADVLQQTQFVFQDWYLVELGVYFAAGSLAASWYTETIRTQQMNVVLILSILLLVAAIWFSFFKYISVLIIPAFVLSFCLRPIPGISNIQQKIGDLSYGMYLYGFPVQQTLVYFFKPDSLELILMSIPISGICAYFSWHLVERKALSFKKQNPVLILARLWEKYKPVTKQGQA